MSRFSALMPVFASVLLLCCGRSSSDTSNLSGRFSNAERRLANEKERQGMVRLTPRNSAGFLVSNTAGKILVATARHTLLSANLDPAKWCLTGEFIGEHKADKDAATPGALKKFKLRCDYVVFDDYRSDTVLFSASTTEKVQPLYFRLATFDVRVQLPLAMIGYPKDKDWLGKSPVVTEKCWVTDRILNRNLAVGINDKYTFGHNCTVYSGNSGGPIIIEGTDIVVGMPVTYQRPDGANIPEQYEGAEIPLKTESEAAANMAYVTQIMRDGFRSNKSQNAAADLGSIVLANEERDALSVAASGPAPKTPAVVAEAPKTERGAPVPPVIAKPKRKNATTVVEAPKVAPKTGTLVTPTPERKVVALDIGKATSKRSFLWTAYERHCTLHVYSFFDDPTWPQRLTRIYAEAEVGPNAKDGKTCDFKGWFVCAKDVCIADAIIPPEKFPKRIEALEGRRSDKVWIIENDPKDDRGVDRRSELSPIPAKS